MKRRYRYALNLLSLGLLIFALYLNFIRKEAEEDTIPAANKSAVGKPHPDNGQKSTSFSTVPLSKTLVLK